MELVGTGHTFYLGYIDKMNMLKPFKHAELSKPGLRISSSVKISYVTYIC